MEFQHSYKFNFLCIFGCIYLVSYGCLFGNNKLFMQSRAGLETQNIVFQPQFWAFFTIIYIVRNFVSHIVEYKQRSFVNFFLKYFCVNDITALLQTCYRRLIQTIIYLNSSDVLVSFPINQLTRIFLIGSFDFLWNMLLSRLLWMFVNSFSIRNMNILLLVLCAFLNYKS